jgi:cobalt-zinc-cadmium efflux system outer membrane protein
VLTAVALILAMGACRSFDEDIGEDTTEVASSVRERTGQDLPAWSRKVPDGPLTDDLRSHLADLDEGNAIKIALLNNREVRAGYERVGIARADLVQAGLLTNPVFGGGAKFFADGTEIDLGLSQSFLDIFYVPLRRRMAEYELEAAKATITRQLVHLTFEVRRGFVRVRAAQQLVEMQAQLVDVAAASRDLMGKLHDAGNVTHPQLTGERVALSRAKLDLAKAEQFVHEAREPLTVLMGLWGNDIQWVSQGRMQEDVRASLELHRVESRSVQASLALIENAAHINAIAQMAGLAGWEGLLSDDDVGVAATREPGEGWGAGPSLALDIPLFDQGQAKAARAQAMVRERLHHHTQLAVEVRSAARLLRDRFLSLSDRLEYHRREHLPARARFVQETLQYYNAMQIGAFDVLAAKQQEIKAGREYLKTLRDAWLARLDLEELLAGSMNHGSIEPAWPTWEGGDTDQTTGGH